MTSEKKIMPVRLNMDKLFEGIKKEERIKYLPVPLNIGEMFKTRKVQSADKENVRRLPIDELRKGTKNSSNKKAVFKSLYKHPRRSLRLSSKQDNQQTKLPKPANVRKSVKKQLFKGLSNTSNEEILSTSPKLLECSVSGAMEVEEVVEPNLPSKTNKIFYLPDKAKLTSNKNEDVLNLSSSSGEFLELEAKCGISRAEPSNNPADLVLQFFQDLDMHRKQIEDNNKKIEAIVEESTNKIRHFIEENRKSEIQFLNEAKSTLNKLNDLLKSNTYVSSERKTKKSKGLREIAIANNFEANIVNADENVSKALTYYNSMRRNFNVLTTPKTDRKLLFTPKTDKKALSYKLQKQCLMLYNTPLKNN